MPCSSSSSAGRPAIREDWSKCGFYNVGWNEASKKHYHKEEYFVSEICDLIEKKSLDALGISEVFNLRPHESKAANEKTAERRQAATDAILKRLNGQRRDFVHCKTCRLEWKLPDPPGGCCTMCGARVADGKRPHDGELDDEGQADEFYGQPLWKAVVDGHYIFLWNSIRLSLLRYKYESCGIEQQVWRMAQHLEFQRTDAPDTDHSM